MFQMSGVWLQVGEQNHPSDGVAACRPRAMEFLDSTKRSKLNLVLQRLYLIGAPKVGYEHVKTPMQNLFLEQTPIFLQHILWPHTSLPVTAATGSPCLRDPPGDQFRGRCLHRGLPAVHWVASCMSTWAISPTNNISCQHRPELHWSHHHLPQRGTYDLLISLSWNQFILQLFIVTVGSSWVDAETKVNQQHALAARPMASSKYFQARDGWRSTWKQTGCHRQPST